MRTWFQRLMDALAVTQTEETLRKAVADLIHDLGFGGFAFLHVEPSHTIAVSNYPDEWQRRYLEENYPSIDPIVKTARMRLRPFTWRTRDPRSAETRKIRHFYEEANDFGIRSGISIPVRTAFQHISMLTLASDRPSLSLETDVDQIAATTAVGYLHAKIEQQNGRIVGNHICELTPKQALCLKWSAEGKTMRDIAVLENMSFATVIFSSEQRAQGARRWQFGSGDCHCNQAWAHLRYTCSAGISGIYPSTSSRVEGYDPRLSP